MQIVIDIPERVYEDFTKTHGIGYVTKDTIRTMENALVDGIQLPKGHGRLIDADKLLKEARIDIWTDYGFESKISSIDVESAPTIIEADKGSEG